MYYRLRCGLDFAYRFFCNKQKYLSPFKRSQQKHKTYLNIVEPFLQIWWWGPGDVHKNIFRLVSVIIIKYYRKKLIASYICEKQEHVSSIAAMTMYATHNFFVQIIGLNYLYRVCTKFRMDCYGLFIHFRIFFHESISDYWMLCVLFS